MREEVAGVVKRAVREEFETLSTGERERGRRGRREEGGGERWQGYGKPKAPRRTI